MTWARFIELIGLVGGLGGITALRLVPMQRRKLKVDAAAVIVDSAVDLLKPLREEIGALERRNERMLRRTERLESELDKALSIVREIKQELAGPRPSVEKLRGIVRLTPRNGT
jgi:uncharacterized protein (UPF0335 family)